MEDSQLIRNSLLFAQELRLLAFIKILDSCFDVSHDLSAFALLLFSMIFINFILFEWVLFMNLFSEVILE